MSRPSEIIDLTGEDEGALHTASPVLAVPLSVPVSKSVQRRRQFPTNPRQSRDFKHSWYQPSPLTTIGKKLLVEKDPLPSGMIIIGAAFLDDYELPSRAWPSYDQEWYYISRHTRIDRLMAVFADFIRKDPANLYFYYKKTQIDPRRTSTEVSFEIIYKRLE